MRAIGGLAVYVFVWSLIALLIYGWGDMLSLITR